jgi:hypothetical protein
VREIIRTKDTVLISAVEALLKSAHIGQAAIASNDRGLPRQLGGNDQDF